MVTTAAPPPRLGRQPPIHGRDKLDVRRRRSRRFVCFAILPPIGAGRFAGSWTSIVATTTRSATTHVDFKRPGLLWTITERAPCPASANLGTCIPSESEVTLQGPKRSRNRLASHWPVPSSDSRSERISALDCGRAREAVEHAQTDSEKSTIAFISARRRRSSLSRVFHLLCVKEYEGLGKLPRPPAQFVHDGETQTGDRPMET